MVQGRRSRGASPPARARNWSAGIDIDSRPDTFRRLRVEAFAQQPHDAFRHERRRDGPASCAPATLWARDCRGGAGPAGGRDKGRDPTPDKRRRTIRRRWWPLGLRPRGAPWVPARHRRERTRRRRMDTGPCVGALRVPQALRLSRDEGAPGPAAFLLTRPTRRAARGAGLREGAGAVAPTRDTPCRRGRRGGGRGDVSPPRAAGARTDLR